MPIKIDFLANVAAFLRGTKDVEGSLDKVADSLDDVARDGDDALEDLERSLKDTSRASDNTARNIDQDGEKAERSFRDLARAARDTSKDVDDVGTKGKSGFGKLGEAGSEVASELGQNVGQAVSSLRDNIGDLGQVGQDTLGGLAATIAGTGPAGIAGAAALAAGAAGLGLITAEIQKENERVQKLKDYFSEAWQTAVEGGRDYIDQATIIGQMNAIMFDKDNAEQWKQIQSDAKTLGLDTNVVLRAAAGDQKSLNDVLAVSNSLYGEQRDKLDELGPVRTKGMGPQQSKMQQEADTLHKINDRWKQYGDINDENKTKAKGAADAISDQLLAEVGRAKDVGVEVDKLGNKIVHLPDGDVYIDAHTGKASSDVSKFKGDVDDKIDQINGRKIVAKVHTDTSSLDNTIRRLQQGISLPVRVYSRDRFVKVIE